MRPKRSTGIALTILAGFLLAACDGKTSHRTARAISSPPPISPTPLPQANRDKLCERVDFDLGDINRFHPPVRTEGETTVVPVTFLDGSSVELLVPRTLDIASKGLSVYSVGRVKRFVRDFWIFPASLDQVLLAFRCPRALNAYDNGQGDVVGFWRFPADPEIDYLAFAFGEWTVLVYDYRLLSEARMTNRVRELWVKSLRGRETRDGFLVLSARPPLRLAGGDSPSPYTPTLTLFGKDGKAELTGNYCPPPRKRNDSYWCLDGHVTVKPLGSKRFAQTLKRVLDSRAFIAPAG